MKEQRKTIEDYNDYEVSTAGKGYTHKEWHHSEESKKKISASLKRTAESKRKEVK